MRFNKDKTALAVNPSLTLAGIPPETFEYRLGNRSALEWVVDQYRVTEDERSGIKSDPNREDDPSTSCASWGRWCASASRPCGSSVRCRQSFLGSRIGPPLASLGARRVTIVTIALYPLP